MDGKENKGGGEKKINKGLLSFQIFFYDFSCNI